MTIDNFDKVIPWVLKHEGGLVSDPRDRGGTTNFGISLRFLKLQNLDLDEDGDVDANDVINLDKNEAKKIYRDHWWDRYGYNLIKDIRISAKIFDAAVNMGPNNAHKCAQIAMNRLLSTPTDVDGWLGPESLQILNTFSKKNETGAFLKTYRVELTSYYKMLVAKHPNLMVYYSGWINRAKDDYVPK